MTSVFTLLALGLLARGEIFGDLRLGDKYVADVKLTLTCGAETRRGHHRQARAPSASR